ncbi:MAG: MBL fold metallo-hydrolase [Candidatus Lokiarchaeota archaeon]|nr:MBL fold metallo-hydrolase [Candidatus Lokiarchaeota archaeon]
MLKVKILGTATAVPRWKQSRTAFLLERDNKQFLVDCGSRRILYKTNPLSLSKIFISHLHADHIQYLGLLILKLFFTHLFRAKPVEIYCLRGHKKYLQHYIRIFTPAIKLKFVEFIELDIKNIGTVFQNNGMEVSAARATHAHPTLCYSFKFPEGKVMFASDTCANNRNIIKIAKNSDYLIHECVFRSSFPKQYSKRGHSTTRGAGLDARLSHSKNLIITHYNINRFKDRKKMVAEIRDEYDGKIIIADDMLTFSIP